MSLITQLLGYGAILTSLIIYSRRTRSGLLAFKSLQDCLWCLHYLLLGAYTASATSLVCVARSAIYSQKGKKFVKASIWLPFFIGLYILSAVLTWQGPVSILPPINSSLSAIAFWMNSPRRTKAIQIAASFCTLTYNILAAHSIPVYIGVTITVVTASVSLLRTRPSRNR